MITATRVFIWIGMIFGCFLIYPIIVGAIALKKLKTANKVTELITISIFTIFLCNIVAGILMLLLKDEDLIYA